MNEKIKENVEEAAEELSAEAAECAEEAAAEDIAAEKSEAENDEAAENTAEEAAGDPSEEAEAAEAVEETKDAEGADGSADAKKAGKGFKARFSGKEKREKKELEKKDEQIAQLTERLQRSVAEFDNYRKRTEKEKSAMYSLGVKSVVEQILPVIDNFERGLAQIPEEQKEEPVPAGMQAIYRQFLTTLDSIGVKPIEAVGQAFNPDFHNAVMHVEDESVGENTVVEEFQKGYMYQDLVIRYSMVKVAN